MTNHTFHCPFLSISLPYLFTRMTNHTFHCPFLSLR